MSSDAQLIDMAALRAKLLVAQDRLRSGPASSALPLISDAIEMLSPRLDPEAARPEVPRDAVTDAITAAHEVLVAAGVENPVEILIVQTHDEAGQTTGRSLASSAVNPQDLLRLCLRNVQRQVSPALKQRRDFLENT